MRNMEENEHKQRVIGRENCESDDLDRVLDAALAKYSAVAPRAGLEERVLANIRAERARSADRAWWRWSVAGALAVVIAVAALAWRASRASHPAVVLRPSSTTPSLQRSGMEMASNNGGNESREQKRAVHKKLGPQARGSAVVAGPKLDQFPSPAPLTEEELALARYVRQFPGEATLIAQAQEEYEIEVQRKMREAGTEAQPSNSDNHER
jgi:hypothetical protein